MGALVAFEASGWRYLQVALGDTVDRSAPAFDDSGWPIGDAAFGYTPDGDHPWGWPGRSTTWDLDTALWVRRSVTVPDSVTQLFLRVRVDNDAEVYWNGSLVGSIANDQFSHDEATIQPATWGASNTLAVRAADLPTSTIDDRTYLDVSVMTPRKVVPPLRQSARSDGYGLMSTVRRVHPPARSVQAGVRRHGSGTHL